MLTSAFNFWSIKHYENYDFTIECNTVGFTVILEQQTSRILSHHHRLYAKKLKWKALSGNKLENNGWLAQWNNSSVYFNFPLQGKHTKCYCNTNTRGGGGTHRETMKKKGLYNSLIGFTVGRRRAADTITARWAPLVIPILARSWSSTIVPPFILKWEKLC